MNNTWRAEDFAIFYDDSSCNESIHQYSWCLMLHTSKTFLNSGAIMKTMTPNQTVKIEFPVANCWTVGTDHSYCAETGKQATCGAANATT